MYTLLQMFLESRMSRKVRWITGILMVILIFSLLKINRIFIEDGVIAFKPVFGLAPFDVYNGLVWSLFSILMLVDIFMVRKHFLVFIQSWFLFIMERLFDKDVVKQGMEHLEELILRLLSLNQIVVFLMTTIGTFFLAFYMIGETINSVYVISLVTALYILNGLYSRKFRRVLVRITTDDKVLSIIPFLVVLGLYITINYFNTQYSYELRDFLTFYVVVETLYIGYSNYDYYKVFYKKDISDEDKIDLG